MRISDLTELMDFPLLIDGAGRWLAERDKWPGKMFSHEDIFGANDEKLRALRDKILAALREILRDEVEQLSRRGKQIDLADIQPGEIRRLENSPWEFYCISENDTVFLEKGFAPGDLVLGKETTYTQQILWWRREKKEWEVFAKWDADWESLHFDSEITEYYILVALQNVLDCIVYDPVIWVRNGRTWRGDSEIRTSLDQLLHHFYRR